MGGLGRSPPLSPRLAVHWGARTSLPANTSNQNVSGCSESPDIPICAAAEPPARRILDSLPTPGFAALLQLPVSEPAWRPGRPGRLDVTLASSTLAPFLLVLCGICSLLKPPRPRTPLPPHPLTRRDGVTPSAPRLDDNWETQGVAGREGSSLKLVLNTARLSSLFRPLFRCPSMPSVAFFLTRLTMLPNQSRPRRMTTR